MIGGGGRGRRRGMRGMILCDLGGGLKNEVGVMGLDLRC